MPSLGDVVLKVRSKNAGPFWLTVDIFCGSKDVYERLCAGLTNDQLSEVLKTPQDQLKRFDIASLNVVKISIPRPVVQGSMRDRDMHGAAIAARIAEIPLPD